MAYAERLQSAGLVAARHSNPWVAFRLVALSHKQPFGKQLRPPHQHGQLQSEVVGVHRVWFFRVVAHRSPTVAGHPL